MNNRTDRIKISRDVIFLDRLEHESSNDSEVDLTLKINNKNCKGINEDGRILAESSSKGSEPAHEEEYDGRNQQDEAGPFAIRRSERMNKGLPPDRKIGIIKLTTFLKEDPRNRNEALSGFDKEH